MPGPLRKWRSDGPSRHRQGRGRASPLPGSWPAPSGRPSPTIRSRRATCRNRTAFRRRPAASAPSPAQASRDHRGHRHLPRDTAVSALPNRSMRSICDRLDAEPSKCSGCRTPVAAFREVLAKPISTGASAATEVELTRGASRHGTGKDAAQPHPRQAAETPRGRAFRRGWGRMRSGTPAASRRPPLSAAPDRQGDGLHGLRRKRFQRAQPASAACLGGAGLGLRGTAGGRSRPANGCGGAVPIPGKRAACARPPDRAEPRGRDRHRPSRGAAGAQPDARAERAHEPERGAGTCRPPDG